MSTCSPSAKAYVAVERSKDSADPTWMDVARAYDEGMRHGILAKPSARRQMIDRCKQCGFPQYAAIHCRSVDGTSLTGKKSPGSLRYHEFEAP